MTEEIAVGILSGPNSRATGRIIYSYSCLWCNEFTFGINNRMKFCGKQCSGKSKGSGNRLFRSGEKSPQWKGGKYIDPDTGYVFVRSKTWSEDCGAKRRVRREHRVVMEAHLGRRLGVHENVHHKNGVRSDNRIENLELWCTPQPYGQRVEDMVQWVFDNYNKEIRAKIAVQDVLRAVIVRIDFAVPAGPSQAPGAGAPA